MTLVSSFTLFLSLVTLALIPGPGVLAVVVRASTGGFGHGVSTALGVVVGDFVFITMALLGLAALSGVMGEFFFIVKTIGAAYLVWLGISIVLSESIKPEARTDSVRNHLTSFSTGLMTTLGNPKAILFYASIFPALIDLTEIAIPEAIVLYIIAALAVGGVMLGYAYLACKAGSLYQLQGKRPCLRYGSGAVLLGSGLYVAARG